MTVASTAIGNVVATLILPPELAWITFVMTVVESGEVFVGGVYHEVPPSSGVASPSTMPTPSTLAEHTLLKRKTRPVPRYSHKSQETQTQRNGFFKSPYLALLFRRATRLQ